MTFKIVYNSVPCRNSQTLVLKGTLPTYNEYIYKSNNRFARSKMKKDLEERIHAHILEQGLEPIEKQVDVKFRFFEKNKRRDKDNIEGFAKKVVLDALVKYGILTLGDGWKGINRILESTFEVSDEPRIEVLIYEV